eukprot:2291953-Pyramimonas_sp.AAC.1
MVNNHATPSLASSAPTTAANSSGGKRRLLDLPDRPAASDMTKVAMDTRPRPVLGKVVQQQLE